MIGAYARIYGVVRRIPAGCVASYGQVARLAGLPGQARRVGYALSALDGDDPIPWHRVVNAQGGISPRAEPQFEGLQRALLEGEGVVFGPGGRIALPRFQWQPRPRARRARPRPRPPASR